jgi:acyl-CoA thioester hydrolase
MTPMTPMKPVNPMPSARSDYAHFHIITTRWMDNDAYGHVNNVVYYSWFDTVVNRFLIIETQCNYFAPVSFPEPVTAGLRVGRLGNSSVRYEVGLFRGDEETAAAHGHFIHVYVDRATRKPVQQLPAALRALLQTIYRTTTTITSPMERQ